MSVRKGKVPCLALAKGLWLGKMPGELKSLRFVEKSDIHVAMLKLHLVCGK